VYRLEQRLEKLMNYTTGGLKEYEQSVVPWQKDDAVRQCGCGRKLEGSLLERKHHCRLCGLVICTGCSRFLPVRVSKAVVNSTRVCLKCDSLIMRRSGDLIEKRVDFELEQTFAKLIYLKEQIGALMPRYEELLADCRERRASEDELRILYMETSAARDTLMLQFLHLEAATKRLKNDAKGYEKLLRESIFKALQFFLQRNLLKLQMLPSFEELQRQRQKQEESKKLEGMKGMEEKRTGTRAFIKQIYAMITSSAKGEEERDEREEGGVLLANLQTLVNKHRVLVEQEEQLREMIQGCGEEDDRTLLQEALVECQQELLKISDLLKKV
jgi:hypothetical protein